MILRKQIPTYIAHAAALVLLHFICLETGDSTYFLEWRVEVISDNLTEGFTEEFSIAIHT
jgi:hypothetical protein